MTRQFATKEPLNEVINIPVNEKTKTLIRLYATAKGFHEYTAMARAMLQRSLLSAMREMSEDEREIMKSLARTTLLAGKIEEIMLNDIT